MSFEDFMAKYDLSLTNQQIEAVKRIKGQTLLLSVPGSGKTTVINARTAYMISMGINPLNILTVTFSKAAANDMKKRFVTVFGDEYAYSLQFRTIHSLCYSIINIYLKMTGKQGFELIEENKYNVIVREIYKSVTNEFITDIELRDIKTKISYCYNMMFDAKQVKELNDDIEFDRIFSQYTDYKKANRLMDFDDQLIYAYQIIKNNKSILDFLQKKYQYVAVDEAQDTSKIQHEIIKILVSKDKNIFMVGDEDQSIYRFRGAYPEMLIDFKKYYPDAEILKMEQNFRSTPQIVKAADDFIAFNKNRFTKHIKTDRENGIEIKHTTFPKRVMQYEYLTNVLCNANTQTAVLFRSNESAIPIIDLLDRNNINFYMRDHDATFFSHFIVRDVISFFDYADNYSSDAFEKIYFKVGCSIRKSEFEMAKEKADFENDILSVMLNSDIEYWKKKKIKKLSDNFKRIKKQNTLQALNTIIYLMGYYDYLERISTDMLQLNSYMQKLNTLIYISYNTLSSAEFIARLEKLKIIAATQRNSDCDVILSTIHSSKGLEYEKVILIDVCDGVFPVYSKEDYDVTDKDETEVVEEDRRLFYVAVTRAKNELEIISSDVIPNNNESISWFTRDFLKISSTSLKHIINERKNKLKASKEKVSEEIYKEYKVGTEIKHLVYGKGVIKDINNNIITIYFYDKNIKKFDINVCINNNIIKKLTVFN